MLSEIKSYYNIEGDSEFARFLDITPQTLHNWRKRNTFDTEIIYTKCLDISAEWLLTGKGEMLRPEKKDEKIIAKEEKVQYGGGEEYWRGRYDQIREDYEKLLKELGKHLK